MMSSCLAPHFQGTLVKSATLWQVRNQAEPNAAKLAPYFEAMDEVIREFEPQIAALPDAVTLHLSSALNHYVSPYRRYDTLMVAFKTPEGEQLQIEVGENDITASKSSQLREAGEMAKGMRPLLERAISVGRTMSRFYRLPEPPPPAKDM